MNRALRGPQGAPGQCNANPAGAVAGRPPRRSLPGRASRSRHAPPASNRHRGTSAVPRIGPMPMPSRPTIRCDGVIWTIAFRAPTLPAALRNLATGFRGHSTEEAGSAPMRASLVLVLRSRLRFRLRRQSLRRRRFACPVRGPSAATASTCGCGSRPVQSGPGCPTSPTHRRRSHTETSAVGVHEPACACGPFARTPFHPMSPIPERRRRTCDSRP